MTRAASTPMTPREHLVFWSACLLASTLFFVLMYAAESQYELNPRWSVDTLDIIESDAPTPPGADAPWRHVELPHYDPSSDTSRRQHYEGWLRIALPDAYRSDQGPWLLANAKPVGVRYGLWLDGRAIDPGAAETTRHRPTNPRTFALPAAADDPARYIHLRVTRLQNVLAVGRMMLGPRAEVSTHAAPVTFMQRTFTRALMAMMAIMCFLMAVIHFLERRRDTVYGWYAIAMSAWLLHIGHSQLEVLPFGDAKLWGHLTLVTLAGFVFTAAVFNNRVIRRPMPVVEWSLLVFGAAGTAYFVAGALMDWNVEPLNRALWIPLIICVGVYMVVRLGNAASKTNDPDLLVLLAGTFLVLLVGIRDYLYNDLRIISGALLYLNFVAALVLVVFSFVLIRRFANAIELARRAAPAPTTDYEEVLTQEHDVLGDRIDDLISNVENNAELGSLRRSLDHARADLQLIHDSLSDDGWSSQALLESLRDRLAASAHDRGVAFTWSVDTEIESLALDPHQLLSAARFVQSAAHEALERDGLQRVQIEGNALNDSIEFRVAAVGGSNAVFWGTSRYERIAQDLGGRITQGQDAIALSWPRAQ